MIIILFVVVKDVMIDHSWKQRHVAISTPMFVETQSSQSSSGSPSQTPSDGTLGLRGEIRATQDGNQFTATQDLGTSIIIIIVIIRSPVKAPLVPHHKPPRMVLWALEGRFELLRMGTSSMLHRI